MFNLDEIASTNLAQIHCSNLALSRVIPGFVKPALIFFFFNSRCDNLACPLNGDDDPIFLKNRKFLVKALLYM